MHAAFINRTAHNSETLGQDIIELDTQGKLFQVPAGEARFAAGVDYRRNTYSFLPDSEISTGDLSDLASEQGSSGAEEVKEIYLEFLSPLVRDLPLAKEINLDLGYRYSDYNTTGGVSTYKADFDWKVIDWVGLRGGYAHATRAPSVGELFLANTGSSVTIGNAGAFGSGDPCDATGAYLSAAKNPTAAQVAALCAAQGVPTGFVNTQPRPLSTSQGNLGLRPESANTFSFGVVLRSPSDDPLFSHMSASVDYYNIDVTDTIGTVAGANAASDDCYSAITNPTFSINNSYCQLVSRQPSTGLLKNIANPLLNLGNYKTSGIDFQADWSAPFDSVGLPSALGSLGLNLLVNYLDQFVIQSTPTAPRLDFAGTIGNTQIDQFADAHPKWKATTTLAWKIASVTTSLRWRYLDGMKELRLRRNHIHGTWRAVCQLLRSGQLLDRAPRPSAVRRDREPPGQKTSGDQLNVVRNRYLHLRRDRPAGLHQVVVQFCYAAPGRVGRQNRPESCANDWDDMRPAGCRS